MFARCLTVLAALVATVACDDVFSSKSDCIDAEACAPHRGTRFLVEADRGAEVWTGDHAAQIIIEPGELAADTEISIQRTSQPAAADDYEVVSNAYEFGPSGTRFDVFGAVIQLHFDAARLGDHHGLGILAVSADGSSELLSQINVDWDASIVSGITHHFTTFVAVLVPSVEIGTTDGDPTAPIVANGTSQRHVDVAFGTGGAVTLSSLEVPVANAGMAGHDIEIELRTLGAMPTGSRAFVNAVVEDPAPSSNLTAPASTSGFVGGGTGWDTILAFVNGLANASADAQGVVRFTADGRTLASSICAYAPVGYPSARVRVTVIIPGDATPIVFWLTLSRPTYC